MNNLTLNTTAKLSFSAQDVALSKGDGRTEVSYGEVVQLESANTGGVLAYNVNEPILGEETYAVTSSLSKKPALRNAFTIEALGESQSSVLCFGDKIRLTTTVNGRKVAFPLFSSTCKACR